MKFVECPQGTPQWFAARCGKITASCFADAISVCTRKSSERNIGDPTAIAERYAADLAIERISGQPHGEPPKAWVLERGHEMEAAARRIYEGRTGAFVTEAGICLTDDDVFGYSTDGLVDDDGLIEIKAPIDSTKILSMWQTGDTSEYDHQMQGGMWITGRKWCDFIMYVPDLANVGKDLYVKRIFRDDAFIDAMVARLCAFDKLVAGYEAVLRDDVVDAEFVDPKAAAQPQTAQQDIPENIPAPAPAHVTPIAAARPAVAPTTPPTLRLGHICDRLGFTVTADFLRTLGFAPAARDKAAQLYHESDFPNLCAALIRHVTAVAQAKAA
jgi:exodeoxyribonuclease (lambda-induced)